MGLVPRSPQPAVPACRQGRVRFASTHPCTDGGEEDPGLMPVGVRLSKPGPSPRRSDSQGNMGLVSRSPQPAVPASRQGRLALRPPAHARWGQWVGGRVPQTAGGPWCHWLCFSGPDLSGVALISGLGIRGVPPLASAYPAESFSPATRVRGSTGPGPLGRAHLPVAVTAKGTWDWYRDHPNRRFQPPGRAVSLCVRPLIHTVGERRFGNALRL